MGGKGSVSGSHVKKPAERGGKKNLQGTATRTGFEPEEKLLAQNQRDVAFGKRAFEEETETSEETRGKAVELY